MSTAAPKVLLHNRCKGRAKIEYTITSKQGPGHQPTFTCEVQINGTTWGTGSGASKDAAETDAAAAAVRYGDERGAFGTL
ncbi:hypothetical protein M378DRAFT_10597 [Amanita muscaria Koide BX008]|uniref:DRBM domain-containing protein n=1 Tax=Amanita muscaria (strain Koide BX008) TaxID=946122 RepID=A0A0C2XAA4_AMAMK|nr:hypothetical protein M378DRAFT_10597 [Amanita muscaria Koide BX008]